MSMAAVNDAHRLPPPSDRRAFTLTDSEEISGFHLQERDMSVVVSNDLSYGEICRKIVDLKMPELVDVTLIDVYEGKNIPAGKVSLTLRLTFQDPERTLTIDRVQDFVDTILSLLKQTFGAELRSI